MTFKIVEATIKQIQDALQSGVITSKQLVQQYFERQLGKNKQLI